MKRLFLVLGTAIAILPWLAGARVQASPIYWSVSASAVGANGSGSAISNSYPGIPSSFTAIDLYPVTGSPVTGTNAATVGLLTLNAYPAGALPWNEIDGEFGGPSSHYQLSLLLRDQASGDSGTLKFNGYFGGELSPAAEHNLTNTFVGPTTQTLKLGSNVYTVTIGPVVLPLSYFPTSDFPDAEYGGISASISVQPMTNSTPEPSSLLLACLGLPPLGLARWLRRRETIDSNA